jgi:two-component system sensor histidine kinase DegS
VSVDIQNDRVLTTIVDNGIGFDAEMAFQNTFTWDSFGLRAIIERARIIGGDAKIESQRGNGTRITVESPINRPRSKTSTRSPRPMLSLAKRVSKTRKKRHG